MKPKRKWLVLFCSVVIAALMLPMIAAASPDQPADGQDAAVVAAQPAQPQVFTTEDGVLQVTLPDDSWKQINDQSSWLALSSGTDHIEIDHLSNGDQLPAMEIAGDAIAEVYQVIYSTKNEVFVLTGTVEDAHNMDEVRGIIDSFKVLKYDTKQAEQPKQPEQPADPVYDIRPIGQNMYCTSDSGVHVRSGYSTDDSIIGGVSYGEQVYVNGMVTKDGQDYGWLQIAYNNSVGYVWGEFFDPNQPAPPAPPTPIEGSGIFLYDANGGNIDIFQFTDGVWRSYDGSVVYTEDENGVWTGSDGSVYYDSPFNPNMDPYPTGDNWTVYSADGTPALLYAFSDGTWRDDLNNIYTPNGDGTITGPHGFPYYESEEDIPDPPILYSPNPAEGGDDADYATGLLTGGE